MQYYDGDMHISIGRKCHVVYGYCRKDLINK